MGQKLHFGEQMEQQEDEEEIELGELVVLTDPTNPNHNRKVRLSDQWVRVKDETGSYHVYVRKGYCWIDGRNKLLNMTSSSSHHLNQIRIPKKEKMQKMWLVIQSML